MNQRKEGEGEGEQGLRKMGHGLVLTWRGETQHDCSCSFVELSHLMTVSSILSFVFLWQAQGHHLRLNLPSDGLLWETLYSVSNGTGNSEQQ